MRPVFLPGKLPNAICRSNLCNEVLFLFCRFNKNRFYQFYKGFFSEFNGRSTLSEITRISKCYDLWSHVKRKPKK